MDMLWWCQAWAAGAFLWLVWFLNGLRRLVETVGIQFVKLLDKKTQVDRIGFKAEMACHKVTHDQLTELLRRSRPPEPAGYVPCGYHTGGT